MTEHEEVCEIGKQIYRDPEGRRFIDYIAFKVCGVGNAITGISDQALAMNAGAHNAGVEILEMLREKK